MAIVASPANFEVDGDTDFTLTVTCSDDTPPPPAPPDPLPPDYVPPDAPPAVVITSVSIDHLETVTLSHSQDTFTVSGQINKLFERSMTYLDHNNISVTVPEFVDIPLSFNTLTQYHAPPVMIKSVFVTITFQSHPTLVYEIVVRYAWQSSNAALKDFAAKGRF
jgi:hypothetical protein